MTSSTTTRTVEACRAAGAVTNHERDTTAVTGTSSVGTGVGRRGSYTADAAGKQQPQGAGSQHPSTGTSEWVTDRIYSAGRGGRCRLTQRTALGDTLMCRESVVLDDVRIERHWGALEIVMGLLIGHGERLQRSTR